MVNSAVVALRADHRMDAIKCPRCDQPHLDKLEWAEKPHHRHLCEGCGNLFDYGPISVGNPLALCNPRLITTGKLLFQAPPAHWRDLLTSTGDREVQGASAKTVSSSTSEASTPRLGEVTPGHAVPTLESSRLAKANLVEAALLAAIEGSTQAPR
jgi:hypothetical protein